jgi:nucleoside-diphosphate-sugar epimerase
MPTVAVTGATGFLGRELVRLLVEQGIGVRAVARTSSGETPGVVQVQADVRDSTQLAVAFSGVEAVFHLAAYVHDRRSRDDSEAQQAVTLGGTLAMLKAAEQVGAQHVIVASSLAVYGPIGTNGVDENHPCKPDTPYGVAKLQAETALVDFTRRTGVFGASMRAAMIYGVPAPGNLSRMIRAVKAGWFPPIPEFGNRRSMVAVADVASAMLLAWKADVHDGRPYNIADGQLYSTRQIYDMILGALGRRPSAVTIPRFAFDAAARAGDLAGAILGRRVFFDSEALERIAGSAHVDASRARRELGFKPTTTLSEIMPALVRSVG